MSATKNPHAQAMARIRWGKTTRAERVAHSKHMNSFPKPKRPKK